MAEPDEIRDLLNKFVVKPIEWGEDEGTDVRNSGFADTHSTGNRQREGALRDEGTDVRNSRFADSYSTGNRQREGALREARQQNMSRFTAVRDVASPTHGLGRLALWE